MNEIAAMLFHCSFSLAQTLFETVSSKSPGEAQTRHASEIRQDLSKENGDDSRLNELKF
jgi:hypothetical protein